MIDLGVLLVARRLPFPCRVGRSHDCGFAFKAVMGGCRSVALELSISSACAAVLSLHFLPDLL
jgi:hypothetical protein